MLLVNCSMIALICFLLSIIHCSDGYSVYLNAYSSNTASCVSSNIYYTNTITNSQCSSIILTGSATYRANLVCSQQLTSSAWVLKIYRSSDSSCSSTLVSTLSQSGSTLCYAFQDSQTFNQYEISVDCSGGTTVAPSLSPTFQPTSPTVAPSTFPAVNPTTALPSLSPSLSPSYLPSFSPSYIPSYSPSTASPTTSPSISPTTLQPSFIPSYAPSTLQPSLSITPTTISPTSTLQPSLLPTVVNNNVVSYALYSSTAGLSASSCNTSTSTSSTSSSSTATTSLLGSASQLSNNNCHPLSSSVRATLSPASSSATSIAALRIVCNSYSLTSTWSVTFYRDVNCLQQASSSSSSSTSGDSSYTGFVYGETSCSCEDLSSLTASSYNYAYAMQVTCGSSTIDSATCSAIASSSSSSSAASSSASQLLSTSSIILIAVLVPVLFGLLVLSSWCLYVHYYELANCLHCLPTCQLWTWWIWTKRLYRLLCCCKAANEARATTSAVSPGGEDGLPLASAPPLIAGSPRASFSSSYPADSGGGTIAIATATMLAIAYNDQGEIIPENLPEITQVQPISSLDDLDGDVENQRGGRSSANAASSSAGATSAGASAGGLPPLFASPILASARYIPDSPVHTAHATNDHDHVNRTLLFESAGSATLTVPERHKKKKIKRKLVSGTMITATMVVAREVAPNELAQEEQARQARRQLRQQQQQVAQYHSGVDGHNRHAAAAAGDTKQDDDEAEEDGEDEFEEDFADDEPAGPNHQQQQQQQQQQQVHPSALEGQLQDVTAADEEQDELLDSTITGAPRRRPQP